MRHQAPNEKRLFWVGSSKSDLDTFPDPVKDTFGTALSAAQFGGKHAVAKPWKGEGPGVVEIVKNFDGNAYRAVYTVHFDKAIYVLHCFQKKSHSGIKTPRIDINLIAARLKLARRDYEEKYDPKY